MVSIDDMHGADGTTPGAATGERRPTVLILDDEQPIHTALERTLQRTGCAIFHATDAEHGLALADATPMHVAIVDLRMRGIDGHTFMRRLAVRSPRTKCIAMSGQASMDDAVEALRSGAVDFLRKPWTPAEVFAALGRALDAYDKG